MTTPSAPNQLLEVDNASHISPEPWDAIYIDNDQDTQTLASSVKKYKFQFGRRYHAFKEGEWFLPNDEYQQDQMDLFHEVYCRGQGGGLFLAPLINPRSALDVGTGTGIWAVQFADVFPNCKVIGNDLSPIQPDWVPVNVRFEVDDINDPWFYPSASFDYIHARAIHGAIRDWGELSKKAYDTLRPGGWFEVSNEYPAIGSDDNTFPADSPIRSWMKNAVQGCDLLGKTAMNHIGLEGWMRDAGFDMTTYRQHIFKIPIGTWARGRAAKELGAMNLLNLIMGIEGFLLILYTKVLGFSEEFTKKEIADIKIALKNKKQHLWLPMHTTYAQKPFNAPQPQNPPNPLHFPARQGQAP